MADNRSIRSLHLSNKQRQVCCGYIKDACIIWELTIDIPHQLMGTMAGPVEYCSFVDDRNSFELIISDKRPFREAFSELLRHILVAA